MLKLNNTFLNQGSNKFYKILDIIEEINYYLLVRTQDNPESGDIQYMAKERREIVRFHAACKKNSIN